MQMQTSVDNNQVLRWNGGHNDSNNYLFHLEDDVILTAQVVKD